MPTSGRVRVDDLVVEVTVRRVRRMNVRVHPPHGDVRLSVPPRTSDRAVVRFVRESRAWIDHHRALLAEERPSSGGAHPPARVGVTGEVWPRFGAAWRLEVEAGVPGPRVVLRPARRLIVRVPDAGDRTGVLAALDRWQRRELRAAARMLVVPWSATLGVEPRFLGLRRMTTRWGTCVPSRGRIWLNLALVERHPALLEYVVVHELAHLHEASHGPAFRAILDQHLPDWRERRAALDAPAGARGGRSVRGLG